MNIKKTEDFFLIKIYKETLNDFDYFEEEQVQNLFQKIFSKLLKKYDLKGIMEVDVYVNEHFGMIIEIKDICSYLDEIDIHIHFHIGSLFLVEIENEDIFSYSDVYYYKKKFYGVYQKMVDSPIFYKENEEIIEKGIKVY